MAVADDARGSAQQHAHWIDEFSFVPLTVMALLVWQSQHNGPCLQSLLR